MAETSAKTGSAGRPLNSATSVAAAPHEHLAPFAPDDDVAHLGLPAGAKRSRA